MPVNYGATGATIGHEMTHGFDDEGAKFDGHGNLKDWWAPADLKKFREATRCIAEQYSRFEVSGGLHVQGELVTGEATADLGGLILAWRALHAAGAERPLPAAVISRPISNSSLPMPIPGPGPFARSRLRNWSPPTRTRRPNTAPMRLSPTAASFQPAFGIPTRARWSKPHRCVIW